MTERELLGLMSAIMLTHGGSRNIQYCVSDAIRALEIIDEETKLKGEKIRAGNLMLPNVKARTKMPSGESDRFSKQLAQAVAFCVVLGAACFVAYVWCAP